MRLERDSNGQWAFRQLAPFELALLRDIPAAARADGEGPASGRLYPGLFHRGGGDEDSERDWSELVHPSLQSMFETALQRVQSDLDRADASGRREHGEPLFEIEVPVAHAEAWLSGLNQARLSLAERFDLYDDADEPRPLPEPPETVAQQMQWRAALQTELYGYVMEWILENVIDP